MTRRHRAFRPLHSLFKLLESASWLLDPHPLSIYRHRKKHKGLHTNTPATPSPKGLSASGKDRPYFLPVTAWVVLWCVYVCPFYRTQQHNRMYSSGHQTWGKLHDLSPQDPSVWKPIHLNYFDTAAGLQKPSSPSVAEPCHAQEPLSMCGLVRS